MIVFIIIVFMLKNKYSSYASITWSSNDRIMPKIMLA